MPHLASLLAAFVAISVAMGLLSAGLALPLTGALGAAASGTATAFEDLPENFTPTALAQQSTVVSRDGKTLATPYESNRVIVPLKKIAPVMRKAQIAIEDSRFEEHGGIDVRGTARALVTNAAGGGVTQGGSSITQQYVKMMLVEKALQKGDEKGAARAKEKSYARKLQEMKYALNVEKTMSKKQILQGYLNLAYYGDQTYGVEAAARHYYDKHASELNLSEAATLAGVVQSPGSTDPNNNPTAAQKRRNVVIDRMLALKWITAKEAKAAKKPSVKSQLKIRENEGGTCARSVEPYVCAYIEAYLKTMPELGDNPRERWRNVTTGGLTIETTFDYGDIREARKMLQAKVPPGDPSGVGAAVSTVEPGTGKIRVLAQSSTFKTGIKKNGTRYTEQAWTQPTAFGGTRGWQIGSTAKMYALVTAMERGMGVDGGVNAPFADTRTGRQFFASEFQPACSGTFTVRNDEPIGGFVPFRTMTAKSVNTAFVQLVANLGSCRVHGMMGKMHLQNGGPAAGDSDLEWYKGPAAIALGGDDADPLTLASSFAVLASGGVYCPPNPIEKITDAAGKGIKLDPPKCERVIKHSSAQNVTELLKGVITGGTGTAARLPDGRAAAGKTGTTDDHKQSWFVGYTNQLSTAVYVGTPIQQHEMKGLIGGQYYGPVFGGTIAAPLWSQIVGMQSRGMEKKGIPQSDGGSDGGGSKKPSGDQKSIPNVAGQPEAVGLQTLRNAGFTPVVAGRVPSRAPAGIISYITPTGSAAQGASIQVFVSNGTPPQ